MILSGIKRVFWAVLILLSCRSFAYSMQFSDVTPGYPLYREIDFVTNEGIMRGSAAGKFNPKGYLTRREYAVALVRATECENKEIETVYSFDDLTAKDKDYKSIMIALNMDMITGSGESRFEPGGYVTRSDFITFLVNVLRSDNITKQDAIKALQNTCDDFEDIPDWYKVTAGKAAVLGVLANKPGRERYLDCDKYVTREQAAAFIYKLKEKIRSYKEEEIKRLSSPKIGEGIIIENTVRNGDVVTIPAQTVLPVSTQTLLDSKTTVPGYMFNAKFVNNITDGEHYILFSKDTLLIGKVLEVKKARSMAHNGSFIIEFSATDNKDNLTRLFAVAECEAINAAQTKAGKIYKNTVKGKQIVITQDDVIYIKLYRPIRVNIVTGDIFE